ncbi:hypothetical protein G7046_g9028 [Stylonectria norvegica]|nr:hypothetical protein G7046_g9028 [Stylonectria norvegica]
MASAGGTQMSIDNILSSRSSTILMMSWACASAVAIYWLTRPNRYVRTDHSPSMSPDTVSSLFPDRPIRPLPKRRLRERLSPEVVDSIKYPPSTHDIAPLFYYPPYTLKDEGSPPSPETTSPVLQGRRHDPGRNYTPRRNGIGLPEDYLEENALRSTLVTRSPPEILTRSARRPSRIEQARHVNPQPPPSTTSSVDGYDSFENTNNKKKRKIPSAGDSAINGAHSLNNEIGSLAISTGTHSPGSELHSDRSYSQGYSGTGTFMTNNQGISGPGRGRLGRSRTGRSPLRALSDGNNTWAGRSSKHAPPQWASSGESLFVSSIRPPSISTLPWGSARDMESSRGNVKLSSERWPMVQVLSNLESQLSDYPPRRSSSASSNFLFFLSTTYTQNQHRSTIANSSLFLYLEHEGSGIISNAIANAEKLRPQGQENVSLLQVNVNTGKTTPASTQFTFTCDSQVPGTVQWPGHSAKHNMGAQSKYTAPPGANIGKATYSDGSSKAASRGSGSSRKKDRRQLDNDLKKAARRRRQVATESYYNNPPKAADVWICEFYRRRRQEEIDRKRLLEKAKAKSRKGKKNGTKAPARSGQAATQNPVQPPQTDPVDEHGITAADIGNGQSTQSEEDDEAPFEDDGSNPVPKPPPSINRVYRTEACTDLGFPSGLFTSGLEEFEVSRVLDFGANSEPRNSEESGVVLCKPLTRETANPNAATAAASAFMRREPANPSLSSAAAAAALKALPHPPTNVSQVQSKRTQRRSASVSSTNRSRSRERGGRELHRTPSNGSMTERTFRSPSPGRSPAPRQHDIPPVPTLPNKQHLKDETPSPAHKRTTSLQIQPFRTASQKQQDGRGGSWFGGAAAGDMSNVRHSDAVLEAPYYSDLRPSSPTSSINFSYPRSLLESPNGGYSAGEHAMVYDANSRRMVPSGELAMREYTVRDASEKPVKKKKQEPNRSGTYLAKGNVSRIKGTAVEKTPSESSRTSQESSSTVTRRTAPKQKPVVPKAIPEHAPQMSREETLVEPGSDVEEPVKLDLRKADGATILPHTPSSREPSVGQTTPAVELEPGLEAKNTSERKVPAISQGSVIHAVDDVPVKSSTPIYSEQDSQTLAERQPTEPKAASKEKPASADVAPPSTHRRSRSRVHSESPARTTHFAPTTDQLLVRHEPPPRSLSPRKSAMKQRSPTRGASPSEDGSDVSAAGRTLPTQEDASHAKRRSVRVSFDEPTVLGESTTPPEPSSPVVSSPQTKKAWHNIISRHKREPAPLVEDETMTPRPALPSFGSVREKKSRDTEERPLVRPSDAAWPSQQTVTAPPQPDPSGEAPSDVGQSSDLALGSILAQEQSARNEANISKYREPLPPVVTSVEGSGHISNSSDSGDSSLSSDDEGTEYKEPTREETSRPPNGNGLTSEHKDLAIEESRTDNTIPVISIIQPSPRPMDEREVDSPQDFFDLPGGFPQEDSSEASDGQRTPPAQEINSYSQVTESAPVSKPLTFKQPPPIDTQRSMESTSVAPPSPLIHDIQEEEEETDRSSIYSDAYEDLSDIEGDGFLSLDAVVDSPVDKKFSTKMFEKAIAKSKEAAYSQNSTPTKTTFQESINTPNDWENAKAYWRSLSSDKRRQLETEALEEAGEEGDLDEVLMEKKKTKKRRSLDPKPAESSKAVDPIVTEQLPNPDRVYQIQPGSKWDQNGVKKAPTKQAKSTTSGGMKLKKSMRDREATTVEPHDDTQAVSMRRSMRSSGAPATTAHDGHFRKSLRAEPEASSHDGMRKSLRANASAGDLTDPRATLRKGGRPASYQAPVATKPTQSHRRNQSAQPGAALPAKPALTRRGSDSSESSFKRARGDKGGGFGFRGTMRGNLSAREPAPAPAKAESTKGSSRFSLRSLSPSGSAFRRNSGVASPPSLPFGGGRQGGGMRSSLRPESSDGNRSRTSFSGFSRAPAPAKKAKKASSSRFADSSDEDDAPSAFRSRFAESSDEDEVASPRAKSNGLPKSSRNNRASNSAAAAAMGVPASQVDDEDSPELPDSDDDIVQPKRGFTNGNGNGKGNGNGNGTSGSKGADSALKRSGSGRESLATVNAQSPAARPTHKRRGSFMSAILGRKKDPSDKISRDIKESAVRRDTKLERSTEQLAVLRSTNSNSNLGRLQKRSPSWPLPEQHNVVDDEDDDDEANEALYEGVDDEEKRPSTAGGPVSSSALAAATVASSKPSFLKRRSTSQGVVGLSLAPPADGRATPEGQKKKKFGTLRKMFGIQG